MKIPLLISIIGTLITIIGVSLAIYFNKSNTTCKDELKRLDEVRKISQNNTNICLSKLNSSNN
jgi:hypothetical protein